MSKKPKTQKYTDNINRVKKPIPRIDDIINEQRAEQLRKEMLEEQSKHNLDEIPAEFLFESYMVSQIEENKNDTQPINEQSNSGAPQDISDKDHMLAMQLQFTAEEEEDNIVDVNQSQLNKRTTSSNKNQYQNEAKVRIQPNYYFDDDSNVTKDLEEYDSSAVKNNDSISKVQSGNKMMISGTTKKHDFNEWSTRHVNRLHDYNVNLGNESSFKDVRLGNKAYNSFRRDLEKKGFKKFDQPTPSDKK